MAINRRRAQLVGSLRAVGGAVEELAGELVPRQSPVADELAQRVLGADREQVVQFVDEVSRLGVVDERLGGCDQGAGVGETDPGEGPQAVLVEVGEDIEGVVAAAMRVAGPGVKVLELAKRGAPAGAGPRGTTSSVSVTYPADQGTIYIGDRMQLEATVSSSGGAPQAATGAVWASDAPAVATVSPSDLVTAVSAGEATISAETSAGARGSLRIRVFPRFDGHWEAT